MPIVVQVGRASLRDYGGSGRPAVFVPSLINPPSILDLSERTSLLRWLAGQGVRPLLLDWGAPEPGERELDIAGHVEQLLLPLLAGLGERSLLAGYCLGGTMALAAAARYPVAALALIATPWRFSGFPERARTDLTALWEQAAPAAQAMGVLPMEVLQTSFWRLDPARTIAKFEAFGQMAPDSDGARNFVALEDWANDGPPLTLGAGRELLRDFFRDDLPGQGRWRVAGAPVDPAALAIPMLDISSTTDRIVPAASAAGVGEGRSLALGHVGMIVGSRARTELWEPLARWLSQVAHSC
jgi:polyhydroxyalkanoate synthase